MRPGAPEMITFLNELLGLDQEWMTALVKHRPECNREVSRHPSVQVRPVEKGGTIAGLIGLLNGFYGVYEDGPLKGRGPITILMGEYDDGRERVVGFCAADSVPPFTPDGIPTRWKDGGK